MLFGATYDDLKLAGIAAGFVWTTLTFLVDEFAAFYFDREQSVRKSLETVFDHSAVKDSAGLFQLVYGKLSQNIRTELKRSPLTNRYLLVTIALNVLSYLYITMRGEQLSDGLAELFRSLDLGEILSTFGSSRDSYKFTATIEAWKAAIALPALVITSVFSLVFTVLVIHMISESKKTSIKLSSMFFDLSILLSGIAVTLSCVFSWYLPGFSALAAQSIGNLMMFGGIVLIFVWPLYHMGKAKLDYLHSYLIVATIPVTLWVLLLCSTLFSPRFAGFLPQFGDTMHLFYLPLYLTAGVFVILLPWLLLKLILLGQIFAELVRKERDKPAQAENFDDFAMSDETKAKAETLVKQAQMWGLIDKATLAVKESSPKFFSLISYLLAIPRARIMLGMKVAGVLANIYVFVWIGSLAYDYAKLSANLVHAGVLWDVFVITLATALPTFLHLLLLAIAMLFFYWPNPAHNFLARFAIRVCSDDRAILKQLGLYVARLSAFVTFIVVAFR